MSKSERFFQFALLGVIGSGYLAIAGSGYVAAPIVFFAGLCLMWRAAIVCGLRVLAVPDIAVTIVTIAYIAFVPIDYFFISKGWMEAGIHVVFFVAIVKSLTARTARDYRFVSVIAFLELLAAALFSTNSGFFLWLAVYLTSAVAALIASEVGRVERAPIVARDAMVKMPRHLLAATFGVTLTILVFAIGLFFLLPRTANAALRFFASSRYHLSGFSTEVGLGEVGELKSDSRPVLHVLSYHGALPANLKWRGLALEQFDGHRWATPAANFRIVPPERGMIATADDWQRRRAGTRALYRVELQNVDAEALFVAGTPEFLNTFGAGVFRAPNGAMRFAYVPRDRVRYEVSSFLEPDPTRAPEPHEFRMTMAERSRNLALPGLDARIPLLAAQFAQGATSDEQKARLVERHLRNDYAYTLELPDREPRDPLATFLFERRKGHCEYFASAMTVMLRTLHIPARLVNGFQSGAVNPYTGLLVIRASDAHTWVEAFLPDAGWAVFDPTPSASVAVRDGWMERLNMYLDAGDTFWQEWVLSYGRAHQLTLASRVEEQTQKIRENGWPAFRADVARLAPLWLPRLGAALALGFAWFFLRNRWRSLWPLRKARLGRSNPSDATILYGRMLTVMKKRGIHKPPFFTPDEFARAAPLTVSTDLKQFTDAYNALRFGGDTSPARQMADALERIESA